MATLEMADRALLKWHEDRQRRSRPRHRAGATLRPGRRTPYWLALAHEVERRVGRWGEKAALARHLGISRQRLHLLIRAKTAMPDAERALQLAHWLLERMAGRGELIAGSDLRPLDRRAPR